MALLAAIDYFCIPEHVGLNEMAVLGVVGHTAIKALGASPLYLKITGVSCLYWVPNQVRS